MADLSLLDISLGNTGFMSLWNYQDVVSFYVKVEQGTALIVNDTSSTPKQLYRPHRISSN